MKALQLAPKEHAIKIESLGINVQKADEIEETLREFASELGFSDDRIEAIECRSRDGFIPYSHNKGGIEAVAFMDQWLAHLQGTGFKGADATLEKYHDYNIEYFIEHKDISKEEFEKRMYEDRDDSFQTEFDEYCQSSEDTVLFSIQMVVNSETELTVYFDVCVKDSPYHRQFDDRIEVHLTFRKVSGLKRQLGKLLKRVDVKRFKRNLMDAF